MKQLKLFLAATLISTISLAQTITGPSSMCVGSTITLAGSPSGGTWSSSNAAVAPISSSGVVTGVAAGITVITYMGGGAMAFQNVTVNPAPAAIAGSSSVAHGGTTTLTDVTAGGTWSSSNPSVASINPATGVVTGVGVGTCTISYCLPTGCCVTHSITSSPGLHFTPQIASGEPSISIYPNPAKVNPTLQWENQSTGYVTVSISNIVGREVYKTVVSISSSNGSAPLDLGTLKDGIYILNVKSVDISYTTRLVLQK